MAEWGCPFPSNCVPLSSGSQGLQEAGAVCVLSRAYPWGLCHQPHLHLGGPAGPQHISSLQPAPATWQLPETT